MALRFCSTGALMSTLPLGGRADHQLVHVDVGRVQQAALLGRPPAPRSRWWPRWRTGWCPRAGRPRCPRRSPPLPTFSPMKSMGASSRSPSPMTMVPSMSTRLHLLAHGLDGHLVGVLAVALAHGAGGGDGGLLDDPHELEEQVVAIHAVVLLRALWLLGRPAARPGAACPGGSRGRSPPASACGSRGCPRRSRPPCSCGRSGPPGTRRRSRCRRGSARSPRPPARSPTVANHLASEVSRLLRRPSFLSQPARSHSSRAAS